MSDEETGMETDLVDLDRLLLVDLEKLDESALAYALRRVLADANGPEDPISAFESFI